MMKRIAVSQRVDIVTAYGERRDALDQAWGRLLHQAGLLALPVCNQLDWLQAYLAVTPIDGILLTGGNDLQVCGGDAPERDAVERHLLNVAQQQSIPVLGVCRGMQLMLSVTGETLQPVTGHVSPEQSITVSGQSIQVNSYHDWGVKTVGKAWEIWGVAGDGVIKAVQHRHWPWLGIMWHPERLQPFRSADIDLFRNWFGEVQR